MARSKEATKVLRTTLADGTRREDAGLRSAEEIAEQIQELIISEGLERGARLPSERDLAELMSTSRPTVSQAVRILVVKGLVESRRGSGAYVLRRPEDSFTASLNLMVSLDQQKVPQLAELRLWLETTGAQRAVEVASDKQIQEVADLLEEFTTSVTDVAGFMSADTRFHAALVGGAQNPYLTSIYESVHVTLINYEYQFWIASGETPRWLQQDQQDHLIAIHRPIVTALRGRDSVALQAAVLSHHGEMARHLREAEQPN